MHAKICYCMPEYAREGKKMVNVRKGDRSDVLFLWMYCFWVLDEACCQF